MRPAGKRTSTIVRTLFAGVVCSALVAPVGAQTSIPAPIRPAAAARPAEGGARPAAANRDGEVMRPTATLGPAPGQPAPAGAAQGSGAGAPGLPGFVMPGAVQPGMTGPATGTAAVTPRFPGMPRYLSVARTDVVLFDAPSERANKVFFAPAGMPLEVVSVLRDWVKVRDPEGDLTWVVRDDLTDKRMVVANAVLPLRREPQPMAAAWFNLDRGVIVELLDERPTNGFVRVKYLEGQIGWLPQGEVWGL